MVVDGDGDEMKGIGSQLNRIFSAYRPKRISDGQGGWLQALGEPWEVRGRLRPASAAEREVAAQLRAEISHVLYLEGDADVQRGDVFSGDGDTVRVIAVRRTSAPEHHLECDCLEVQREGPEEMGS